MARCILGSEFQIISGCDEAQGLWDIVRLYFFLNPKREVGLLQIRVLILCLTGV